MKKIKMSVNANFNGDFESGFRFLIKVDLQLQLQSWSWSWRSTLIKILIKLLACNECSVCPVVVLKLPFDITKVLNLIFLLFLSGWSWSWSWRSTLIKNLKPDSKSLLKFAFTDIFIFFIRGSYHEGSRLCDSAAQATVEVPKARRLHAFDEPAH